MGSGMPEIGSRISLISKADIRYEGKLYSVDPEECTIALSSVRSYGTEDRQTGYPVPPQNQVYDYILFRGSDIKDIRVLSTTIPNDPAIVQLSVPPSMNDLQFQSQSGYPPPSIGSLTIPNVPGTSRQPPFQNAEFSIPTTSTSAQIPKPQPVSIPISEDESRSSTPSTQNATQKNAENRSQNAKPEDQNQTQRRQFGRDNRQVQQGQQGRYQQKQYSQQRYNQPQQQQQRYPQQRYQNQPRYMQPQYREYRDNQYRNYDYRDPYAQRQYVKWNNQNTRTGPPANQQQNYQSVGYPNRKPKNTLKFDVDFDFEQANSQFEEVKSKLSAIKIDDSVVKMNGDVESKKEDSGNEVSGEENEPEGDDKPIFYDKVKSFFDQISYEAIERSKGHTQRLDWKTERKINSETFGPVALRRNSNFRGRPGGNFYNNYQGRNTSIANNYRGSYRQQGQNRRPQYTHQIAKNHDDSRGNQSA